MCYNCNKIKFFRIRYKVSIYRLIEKKCNFMIVLTFKMYNFL